MPRFFPWLFLYFTLQLLSIFGVSHPGEGGIVKEMVIFAVK